MLRAIIFDFDGVIADSEPIHCGMLQRVLGEMGIFLSREEYYASYLGFDDRGCFETALATHQRPRSPELINDLIERKAQVFLEYIRDHPVTYPGVPEFIRGVATRLPLAVASGALRHEIEFILDQGGIRKEFSHITSAEDVARGKPNPEGFLHALTALNHQRNPDVEPILPADCLVIEDSLPGIQGGRAAGMKVLAVTNTHPAEQLGIAHSITTSLANFDLTALEHELWMTE